MNGNAASKVGVSFCETQILSRRERTTFGTSKYQYFAPHAAPCHNGGMQSLALTRQQSREIDRVAIEQYGIPGIVLMENAGRGCVDVLERLGLDGPVVIVCGKG